MSKVSISSTLEPTVPNDNATNVYPAAQPALASKGKRKTMSKLSSTLTSKLTRRFPLFSSLPTELRLLIWNAAIPDPLVHELYPSCPTSSPYNFKTKLRSNRRQIPSLLHTNREARSVALAHYQLMSYDPPPVSEPREAVAGITPFYFNPSVDTLFLNCVASIFLDVRWFLLDETPKSIAPMKGWRNVALDSLHMRFVAVVASDLPTPQHRIRELFPDLQSLSIAVDSKNSARRRLRASLRPGHGTELVGVGRDDVEGSEEIEGYFEKDFGLLRSVVTEREAEEEEDDDQTEDGEERPELKMCKVKRDRFYVGLRQDLIYSYVGSYGEGNTTQMDYYELC
ncbi:hypothetical protein CJF30_00001870 [Rutstroemia sp. NJR-2017a BBW]|nr:hypothetical protein CJF30_00001870 [Rutstroemia sp. NJR-2017a BBW]